MQTFTIRRLSWFAGFALALTTLTGCEAQGEEATAATPPAPEVDVVQLQAEDVLLWASFTGRIAAPETVDLRPRVSGYIHAIGFVEGDLVQAGDVLFQIDPRPYAAREQLAQAELARVKSQWQLADAEVKRAQQLWEKRAISREELDQRNAAFTAATAAVDAAAAELATAQLNLEYTQIKAPVSGRIGRAQVTVGNLATADATTLANIVSVNPLYVYFEGDQASVTNISSSLAATPVRVKHQHQDQAERYTTGHLDFIDNHYDRDTGTLQFRAVIDNTDGRFKPGQFARVEMPVGEAGATLLVDDKAVLADQDRRYVYVVNEDNTVARRYVDLGRQFNGERVITAGLQSGDTVVVNGLQRITFPGMEVSPQVLASAPDAAPKLANRH